MTRSKIYKYSALFLTIAIIGCWLYYNQLPNRHKAIIKTALLQKTGLIDNSWVINTQSKHYKMISPAFYIDAIYKSMEGPKSSNYIRLSADTSLVWIKGFHVKALDSKTKKQISNDFICHTNIDFNDVKYFSNFHLDNRIGLYYPRLTSLSHGLENFKFPDGYGIPMKGNDLLYITTEALNHNISDANFLIKHEVTVDFLKNNIKLKPLMSRTVFIALPYHKIEPYKEPLDPGKDYCIPVETKNHSYQDNKGNVSSGHWVIPKGEKTYRSAVDNQLHIKDSLRLHAAAVHVHPFATSLTLWDKTAQKPIFTSKITNHRGKIGLSKIEALSSETGIWMYGNHSYELVITVNNTTNSKQDMMGSMFLFFHDQELDEILTKKSSLK